VTDRAPLLKALGVDLPDELLTIALTHRSYGTDHNERLEFLGDAVLNLAVSRLLYDRFAGSDEGEIGDGRADQACDGERDQRGCRG